MFVILRYIFNICNNPIRLPYLSIEAISMTWSTQGINQNHVLEYELITFFLFAALIAFLSVNGILSNAACASSSDSCVSLIICGTLNTA